MSANNPEKEIVEGWLHVWDTDPKSGRGMLRAGHRPESKWRPMFCVLTPDIGTLTFHKSEQDLTLGTEENSSSTDDDFIHHTRLDGGRSFFQRRWGYEILERIQEHVERSRDASEIGEDASAESFFRSRTHVEYRDEDFTGLCRDCCRKRRRTRSLIPRRGRGPGGKGHVDEDDGDFSDEEEEEDDVDNKSDSNARYSAFDSPLFRRNSGNVDADSSLERMDEQRRGSLPLVSTYNDSMESVSTTSRLANFFTKKGFKSNLKRTKSATKLDRKRSSPNLSEHDTYV